MSWADLFERAPDDVSVEEIEAALERQRER